MTKRKTYYFNNDSWIDTPACDCCDYEYLMEVFNIDLDEHPDFDQNGSAHSIEECFADVLVFEGVIGSDWQSDYYDLDDEEQYLFFMTLLEKHNLQVRIEKMDNPDEYDVYP